ncbi:MAG: Spy/CpxP family protein refolding chaperone [Pseudomonadota bacterium]|nr:Spy/CpxP family protein refolding chaperone [Pseudomonadota bacterium]
MNRRLKIVLISAAAAVGLTAGAAALTAQVGGFGGHGMHMARYAGHAGMRHMCGPEGAERIEDFITFGEIRLKIRDDQRAQWNAVAEALRTGGRDMLTTCERMDVLRGGTPPERLAEVETVMEKGLAAMKGIRAAFDPLYAVLDDDQKATLERLTHRGRHHHMDDDDDGNRPEMPRKG